MGAPAIPLYSGQQGVGVHVQPGQLVTDAQPGFQDGLNSVSNDYALLPTQARRMDNFRLVDIGAATKRGGTQQTGSALATSKSVQIGYSWRQSSAETYLVVLCNGVLKQTTFGTFPLTWTSIGAGFTTSGGLMAGFYDGTKNVLYLATGGALNKWDGTTLTAISNTTAVQATGVTVFNERLWGWGVSGNLDSIWYSGIQNGDGLGIASTSGPNVAGGQIIVRTFGQQDVIACVPLGPSLLICHRRGISQLTGYGQSDITVSPQGVTADVGLVGPNAIDVWNNLAFLVTDKGVYAANAASVTPLSNPSHPDPVYPQLFSLTAAQLAAIVVRVNRAQNELWVQLPGIGIYVYHLILQAWSGIFIDGYLAPDTTALFEGIDAESNPIMLRGDASGFVSQCDPVGVFLDNVAADGTGGTAYNGVLQCHRMFSGNPTRADGYRWAMLLAEFGGSAAGASLSWNTLTGSGTFEIAAQAAGAAWGDAETTWGTGYWGEGGQRAYYVPLNGTGPFIDLLLTDSGMGGSQIASVQTEAFALGRR